MFRKQHSWLNYVKPYQLITRIEKPSNYNYADSTFVYWFPDVAVNNEKMIVASRNDTLIIQDNGVSHGYTQLLTRVR